MISAELQKLIQITLDASHKIMEVYNSDFEADEKADGSAVTEADKAGEAVIMAGLKAQFPEIPILAEEAASDGHIPELGDCFFLVDPVDGTREFVNRTGEFTVNIAMIKDEKPVMGVVYAPSSDRLYFGETANGAFKMIHPHTDELDISKASKIETKKDHSEGLIAVASRSHRSAETEDLLAKLGAVDFTPAGSSLKFCLVAEGVAHVYPRLGRTMEWDTGAGQAVLEAAGGRVMVFEDEETATPLTYRKESRGFDNPYFIAWA